MTSRLDRLVTLLETGTTQLIRNTAADQLADIQKRHPEELFNLLPRVVRHLKSTKWDTRIAAAKAIGGIVENAEKFDPNADEPEGDARASNGNSTHLPVKKEEDDELKRGGGGGSSNYDQLQLETLDVTSILSHGKKLLGSAGKEYDYALASMDPAERLAHQKKSLTARLGLGGEYTEDDLIDESDLKGSRLQQQQQQHQHQHQPFDQLPTLNTAVKRSNSVSIHQDDQQLSSPHTATPQTPSSELSRRQMNMLKRKHKLDIRKQQASNKGLPDFGERRASLSVEKPESIVETPKAETADGNGLPSSTFTLERQADDDESKVVSEFKGITAPVKSELEPIKEEEGMEWPFERLCEYLMLDMFDHRWETRHGAAMALREIIRVHGAGAGRVHGQSRTENDLSNKRWLDDLLCRLCCIFMLDRFGDYVSDNVVAPIRETTGQTLGAVLQFVSPSSVIGVYRILYRLVMQKDQIGHEKRVWEACHGGMIGMRYLVAVRHELLTHDLSFMDGVLEMVIKGLGDWDDDVRAVSAATLLPVCREIVSLRPGSLALLVTVVWDCLSNLSDDLSASTGSVMDLLAKLCTFSQVIDVMKTNAAKDPNQSFSELVPRLYPFLRHTITSVRLAVLRALMTFLNNIKGQDTQGWVDGKALRLVFQNLLVERNEAVLKLSLDTWMALLDVMAQSGGAERLAAEFTPHLAPIITLTLHPIGVLRNPIPMDPKLFVRPSGQVLALSSTINVESARRSPQAASEPPPNKKRRRMTKPEREEPPVSVAAHNIDGPMIQGEVDLVSMDTLVRSRIYAAKALGKVISLWPESIRLNTFKDYILPQLRSSHASTQLAAALLSEEFALASSTADNDDLATTLLAPLRALVDDEPPSFYAEMTPTMTSAKIQCWALRATLEKAGVRSKHLPELGAVVPGTAEAGPFSFSIKQGETLVGSGFDAAMASLSPAQRIAALATAKAERQSTQRELEELVNLKSRHDIRIKSTAAAAIVAFKAVPKKASITIKGLMDSVKSEENVELQRRSALAIILLIQQLVASKRLTIVDKVVGNISKFYCEDTSETPDFSLYRDITDGMLSLAKDEDLTDRADPEKFARDAAATRIKRRGAKEALVQLSNAFGEALFEKIPSLQDAIEGPLRSVFADRIPADITADGNALGQEAVDSLSTLRALVPTLDVIHHKFVMSLSPLIIAALRSPLAVFRYAAAKCFATICSVITAEAFTVLVKEVLPTIRDADNLHYRQGAAECIYHLLQVMGDKILPYVIFLITPVLGRMSDSDGEMRILSTTAFATLVKLVPLEEGIPDPPGLSQELLQGREKERNFMAQMLDPKKIEAFEIPVAIKATLRSYQQDGVNWLAFLNRYHLHGILCDDMGLGKTLQTLCIVASDHHNRAAEYAKSKSSDMKKMPSLIICPPTLAGHWQQEIKTYAPFLTVASYTGPPLERGKVTAKLSQVDVVITSYEIARNDVRILSPYNWNYCVLDEGHLIKNPTAKTTIAVKQLKSNHRLILSGTPIQNNVVELWSLFDFLMPGFLGTEKMFKERFGRPIADSRYGKASSKEQEKGALAIEALHKQVLPFLLRRLKEEVLDDLPPKIIQNYYCDLSELQKKLFDDFTKKQGKSVQELAAAGDKESKQHIFAALNYMKRLCNSPALVLKEGAKQYEVTKKVLAREGTSIRDPVHAPKLAALRDLLVDCGIGTEGSYAAAKSTSNGASSDKQADQFVDTGAVSQHRALIFCQMKEMLDIVQTDVLGKMLPSATYLRLDGSVEANRRQDIVNKFNSDPSIDVLLLTTSVGGLGLNLTGADTVIFVEHDWNPQKDIQAMDRAHRIGQRKVVNVYRLITRGTLEEKILNLQRFKIDVASTVVNQQNAGLASMETDQILDLFTLGEGAESGGGGDIDASASGTDMADGGVGVVDEVTGQVKEKGKKGFLDELGELWDESQYTSEYNLDDFLSRINA